MNVSRLLVAVALTVAPALPASTAAAQVRPQGYLTPEILKEEIGVSLDWLRGQQDETTGGYGNVDETCWALKAFATSPWRYRYADGPFVSRAVDHLMSLQQPSGAIHDPGAIKVVQRAQSSTAAETLAFFKDAPEVAGAWKRVQDFEPAMEQATWSEVFDGIADAGMLLMAEDLLRNRKEAGNWGGPNNQIRPTGRILERLGGIWGVIQARNATAQTDVAEAAGVPLPAEARAKAQKALARGAAFLADQSQDGRWGAPGTPDPGITAMVACALVTAQQDGEVKQATESALDWLVTLQREDGSIHDGQYINYVTSAAVMALARAGREKDKPVIAKAREFLKGLQFDEPEGYEASSEHYGGIGYGSSQRPDLSNTQMAIDALVAAGVDADDPTLKKALEFLRRCQNRSESNDVAIEVDGKIVKSGEDGGAGYAPGVSKAGLIDLPDGTQVARSYGSMTYALLKGYLLAGLPKDDPRVKAAWEWLKRNYTLEVNPGFETSSDPNAPYQGLFYYFHTMAKALDLYGTEVVTDAADTPHAWRGEMIDRLAAMQRQDGSWINGNSARWYEGNPVLATAYAVMALDEALPDAE